MRQLSMGRVNANTMCLNDVESGGGTIFPNVGQPKGTTVIPKRGTCKAFLWPSVLDSDPNTQDSRTNHEAMPVVKGVKYGANAWLHNRNYKGPNLVGCS
jgi:prolyl 4-hydroxylase